MRGDGYKRCKCRDVAGKEIGATCPRLKRSDGTWSAQHGTWYGKQELPGAPAGERLWLRAGGFATKEAMVAWFDEALLLLSIPERGADGHADRLEILALVKESRRRNQSLPGYDDIRRRYREGVAFQPGTTGEYLLTWIARHAEADDLAATTFQSYEAATRRLFLPAFGAVALDKLRSSHVLAMLGAIDAEADRVRAAKASDDPEVRASVAGRRPTGLASKKRYLAVLRSALSDARDIDKLITSNPADIRIGKGGGRKQGRTRARLWTAERERMWRETYAAQLEAAGEDPSQAERFALWRSMPARPGPVMVWTPAQLGAFLDAVEQDRLYAMMCVISHCGLRRGEACGARWEDFDFDAATIMVSNQIVQVGWKAVHAEPKTEASQAHVRMDLEESLPAVKAWRKRQLRERVEWGPAWIDTGLAFTRENGTAYHPAHVTTRFERLAFAAGLPPVRLHDLRHGAATLALAAGADITAVSRMLRHSSVQITADIYAEVLPELAAEVASKVVSMVPRRVAAGGASKTGGLPTVSLGRIKPRSLEG